MSDENNMKLTLNLKRRSGGGMVNPAVRQQVATSLRDKLAALAPPPEKMVINSKIADIFRVDALEKMSLYFNRSDGPQDFEWVQNAISTLIEEQGIADSPLFGMKSPEGKIFGNVPKLSRQEHLQDDRPCLTIYSSPRAMDTVTAVVQEVIAALRRIDTSQDSGRRQITEELRGSIYTKKVGRISFAPSKVPDLGAGGLYGLFYSVDEGFHVSQNKKTRQQRMVGFHRHFVHMDGVPAVPGQDTCRFMPYFSRSTEYMRPGMNTDITFEVPWHSSLHVIAYDMVGFDAKADDNTMAYPKLDLVVARIEDKGQNEKARVIAEVIPQHEDFMAAFINAIGPLGKKVMNATNWSQERTAKNGKRYNEVYCLEDDFNLMKVINYYLYVYGDKHLVWDHPSIKGDNENYFVILDNDSVVYKQSELFYIDDFGNTLEAQLKVKTAPKPAPQASGEPKSGKKDKKKKGGNGDATVSIPEPEPEEACDDNAPTPDEPVGDINGAEVAPEPDVGEEAPADEPTPEAGEEDTPPEPDEDEGPTPEEDTPAEEETAPADEPADEGATEPVNG